MSYPQYPLPETWPLVSPPRAFSAYSLPDPNQFGAPIQIPVSSNDVSCATVKCPDRSHCVDGTCYCDNNLVQIGDQCGCLDGYHLEDGYCVQNTPPPACQGKRCPANASCSNGQCYCNVGYHSEGDACVPNQAACPPGQVFNGARCVEAVQCGPGFVFNGIECVPQQQQLPPQPAEQQRTLNPFLVVLGAAAVLGVVWYAASD